MISYGQQTIDSTDIESIVKALKGDLLTQGPFVNEFEERLAKFFGSKYASVVSSGTAALHLVAETLNLSKDDIVITSPITFLATVNCIEYVGGTPEFVDIDVDNYTINPNLLYEQVKLHRENGRNVKAIIGVDYAGNPCDWESFREIADEFNIILINDNCHAMGAIYNKDPNYAINYADFVTQSFHPVKHITTGEGGAIMTNNKKYHKNINDLKTHGMTKDTSIVKNPHGPWYYEMHQLGFNYRITDIQCALGINQLKRFEHFSKKRKQIASIYDKELSKIEYLKTPAVNINNEHAYHLYPLCIDFNKLDISKKSFFEYLLKNNINLQVHYIPVHIQPYYSNKYNFKYGDYPVSEKFYEQEISLPVYPNLSKKNQKYVIDIIKKYIS